jgi:hypothetical protein
MIAVLRYSLGDSTWEAMVERAGKGEGFSLKIGHWRNNDPIYKEAGTFQTGAAVVKYVRDLASKKFSGWKPTVDTLDSIRHRTAQSIVPDCYTAVPLELGLGGKGFQGCPTCPYHSGCGDPALVDLASVGKLEEDDTNFLARLKGKIASVYGEK